jgi:hypothetical protein
MIASVRAIWFGVALAIVACGGTPSQTRPAQPAPVATTEPSPPPAPPAERQSPKLLAGMQAFSDAMCKCVDKLCADKVTADLVQWAQVNARPEDNHDRISEAEAHRMTDITETLTRCMTTAMMAGQPLPPSSAPR